MAIVCLLLIALAWFFLRRSGKSELDEYLAQLRAQGEKLTLKELVGTPQFDNEQTYRFIRAAGQLQSSPINPGNFQLVEMTGPGRAKPAWKREIIEEFRNVRSGTNRTNTWQDFAAELQRLQDELQTIRELLKNPAPNAGSDYSDVWNLPRSPFVQRRVAAQWFTGASLQSVCEGKLDAALDDIENTLAVGRLHEKDPTLVNSMVHVAIAGLAVNAGWEALQAEGWTDQQLARLQRNFEAIDFREMIEHGLVAERACNIAGFEKLKNGSSLSAAFGGRRNPINSFMAGIWRRSFAEEDELFGLQFQENALKSLRRVRSNKPWCAESKLLSQDMAQFESQLSGPFRFRYFYSAISIPNFQKATGTCLRNETFRRLTVTAITLKRYQLRHGEPAQNLSALIPEFLKEIPLDPMDAKPLKYRLNPNGTFVLYSTGDDGIDNGGNPPASNTRYNPQWWEYNDWLWPQAEDRETGSAK